MASDKQSGRICFELSNCFYQGDVSLSFVEEGITAYQAFRVIELFEQNKNDEAVAILEEYYKQSGGKPRDDKKYCESCKKIFYVTQYAPFARHCPKCYREYKDAKDSGQYDNHYDVMDPKEREETIEV